MVMEVESASTMDIERWVIQRMKDLWRRDTERSGHITKEVLIADYCHPEVPRERVTYCSARDSKEEFVVHFCTNCLVL